MSTTIEKYTITSKDKDLLEFGWSKGEEIIRAQTNGKFDGMVSEMYGVYVVYDKFFNEKGTYKTEEAAVEALQKLVGAKTNEVMILNDAEAKGLQQLIDAVKKHKNEPDDYLQAFWDKVYYVAKVHLDKSSYRDFVYACEEYEYTSIPSVSTINKLIYEAGK